MKPTHPTQQKSVGSRTEQSTAPKLPRACDLLPWEVTDISVNPYAPDDWSFDGKFSFNPSIWTDGKVWLCTLRTSNYAMPRGVEVKAPGSHPMVTRSRNVMLVLDPKTWKPIHVYKMAERDGLPRDGRCRSHGFEDIRLFSTACGALQGVATSLQLEGIIGNIAEMVILSFDAQYNIVGAQPIRVPGLDRRVQKNWAPFTGLDEPRFMYSINDSVVFGAAGPLGDWGGKKERAASGPIQVPAPQPADATTMHFDSPNVMFSHRHAGHAQAVAPPPVAAKKAADTGGPGIATGDYYGLRGGSQLVRVIDDLWLGIGHDGRYVNGIKIYCHTFYAVDDTGLLIARSDPFKLRSDGGGIEFAAGLAIDGDRCVISYGVDDMLAELAETSLEAVLALLKPTGATRDAKRAPIPFTRKTARAEVPFAVAPASLTVPVRIEKPWGHEVIWAHTDRYVGKILRIKADYALSLQYHEHKDETVMLVKGEARLQLGEVVNDLVPYMPVRIAPGTRHRLVAVTDCDIHEVSTPEIDDVIRLEDRYGRAAGGVP